MWTTGVMSQIDEYDKNPRDPQDMDLPARMIRYWQNGEESLPAFILEIIARWKRGLDAEGSAVWEANNLAPGSVGDPTIISLDEKTRLLEYARLSENKWGNELENLLRALLGGEQGMKIGREYAAKVMTMINEWSGFTELKARIASQHLDRDWPEIIRIAIGKFGTQIQVLELQKLIRREAKRTLALQIGSKTSDKLSFLSIEDALNYLGTQPASPEIGANIRQHIYATRNTCKNLEGQVAMCQRSLHQCSSELDETQQAVKSAVAFAKDFQSMLVALGKTKEVNGLRARVSGVGPIEGARLSQEKQQGALLLARRPSF